MKELNNVSPNASPNTQQRQHQTSTATSTSMNSSSLMNTSSSNITVKKHTISTRMSSTIITSNSSTITNNSSNITSSSVMGSSTDQQQIINGATSSTTSSTSIEKNEGDNVELMEVEENTTNNMDSDENMNTMTMNDDDDDDDDDDGQNISKCKNLSDIPVVIKRPLKLGDHWYPLDKKWYDSFLTYLNNNNDEKYHPGKIDNSDLLVSAKNVRSRNNQPTYRLLKSATEKYDFVWVPEEAWNLLVETFGTVDGIGGHHFCCPVIPRTDKYLQIETNPLELRLALYGSKEDIVVQYSRNCTLREVIADGKKFFRIHPNKLVQLWNNATLLISHMETSSDSSNSNISTANTNTPLNNSATNPSTFMSSLVPRPSPPPPSSSNSSKAVFNLDNKLLDIDDLEIAGTVLTIEMQNPDHTWPSSKTKLGAVTRSKLASGTPNNQPGVCGLMNLGNTCFMNAAVQCLSNTAPLTKYFLEDRHIADINPDNPLGMRGEIARLYSDLIKTMWSGFHSNFPPRDFRHAVTQFAPQFSGFAHHDCQELMAFLLDGLHEDLNRVKVKPYIEAKNDIEKRPDEVIATESWRNYKLRNDSIIVDTFHAQLKSTLVCPECQLVSVTFDPFCYLSLPLPYRIERQVDIIFVPAISKRPSCLSTRRNPVSSCATSTSTEMTIHTNVVPVRSILLQGVNIPKVGIASDIGTAVAKYLNEVSSSLEEGTSIANYFQQKFDAKKFAVAHIMDCRLNKFMFPGDPYNSHLDDIVVYEMDDLSATNSESGCQTRSSAKFTGHHFPVFIRQINADHSESIISRPFFITIKSPTYESIREAIFKELCSIVPQERITYFLQSMEEKIRQRGRNAPSNARQYSDGESSDVDDDDNQNSNDSNFEDSEEDDNYTISMVTSNGNNQLSVLSPGVRIDTSQSVFLAINICYRMISNFFPNMGPNKFGYIRLSDHMTSNKASNNSNSPLTLKECINQFTLLEKLGENDPWFCPRCRKHQMASKKFDIWSLPNNLIIHLKRFSYTRSHRDKLNVLVEFPIENLDMSSYVLHNPNNESFVYDLIAVSNHYGELGAGHYNAYGKNFLSNMWFLFDDYSVSPVSNKNKVMTKEAYVLFYQRKQTSDSNDNNNNNEDNDNSY